LLTFTFFFKAWTETDETSSTKNANVETTKQKQEKRQDGGRRREGRRVYRKE
jgi:hypothetical protein